MKETWKSSGKFQPEKLQNINEKIELMNTASEKVGQNKQLNRISGSIGYLSGFYRLLMDFMV